MRPIWDDHIIRDKKILIDTILNIYQEDPDNWEKLSMHEVVGEIMKRSGGKFNPHRVKDFVASVEYERW